MWQAIEQNITQVIGEQFNIKHKQAITGGDINLCYWLSDYQHNYFIKLNDKSRLQQFESEAYSLTQIKQLHTMSCPDVITTGTTLDKSYLVLEYLPFHHACAKDWLLFGKKLAQMHKTSTHGKFGWQHDNYIGTTLQPNNWQSNWRTFFAEQRIGWQLQLLAEKSVKLGSIEHIVSACHDLLMHHQVTPCLVHGDLWQGNLGFNNEGVFIFDPASYYGDREVDIAMTELFGQLPSEFYQGYQSIYPLEKDYDKRKLIYNFYHILNHANLFGGVYIEQSKANLARILALH
jgi:fructosamine-3-kinase